MDWPFRMRAHVVVAGCIALLRATHSRGYSFVRRRYKSWKAVEYGVAPPLRHAHFLTYLGDTGLPTHPRTRCRTYFISAGGGRRRGTCGVAFLRKYSGGTPQSKAPKRQLLRGSPRATYVRTYHRSIASRPRYGRQEPRRVLPACA